MSYAPIKVFTATIASAATLSGEVDLGHAQDNAYLEIQSMVSNSEHFIQAANATGGTYRRVYLQPVSATVQSVQWSVASAASNGFFPLPPGLQYVKVETTATADSGQTYKIVCAY